MKNNFKVVIINSLIKNYDIENEILKEIGAEVISVQCRSKREVIAATSDADGILNWAFNLTGDVLKNLKKCKVIGQYGAGTDRIDVKVATELGIYVVNVPDYSIEEVSDHAIALMFSAIRKILILDRGVRNNNWDGGGSLAKPIYRIRGMTIGLIGFGKIARKVVEKTKTLGVKFIAYDPYVSISTFKHYNVTPVGFEELLRKSDVISVHSPSTTNTFHLIGKREFEIMKESAYLINTSRGVIIDERALFEALKTNEIAGAAIDVMEKEPPDSTNPLLKLENIIITPHNAWYSENAIRELKKRVAEEVKNVLLNHIPRKIAFVNPEVLKRVKK